MTGSEKRIGPRLFLRQPEGKECANNNNKNGQKGSNRFRKRIIISKTERTSKDKD